MSSPGQATLGARPIFLSGMMGSGKSSVARALERLGPYDAVDLDAHIQERCGCSIRELFATLGEAGFRELERESLQELVRHQVPGERTLVVALGGGAVLDASSRDVMMAAGSLVWLDVPIAELVRRLSSEWVGRPLLGPSQGWGGYAARPGMRLVDGLRERAPLRLRSGVVVASPSSILGLGVRTCPRPGLRVSPRPQGGAGRPRVRLWLEARIAALLTARLPMYEASRIRVDGCGLPDEVARRLLAVLEEGPP